MNDIDRDRGCSDLSCCSGIFHDCNANTLGCFAALLDHIHYLYIELIEILYAVELAFVRGGLSVIA